MGCERSHDWGVHHWGSSLLGKGTLAAWHARRRRFEGAAPLERLGVQPPCDHACVCAWARFGALRILAPCLHRMPPLATGVHLDPISSPPGPAGAYARTTWS
eukprot:scaffold1534_cov122-Isochrysis_galbana.AAC.7